MTTTRFDRTQILLVPGQRRKLTSIAAQEKRSLSDVVREMIDAELAARKRRDMEAAALALLSDYQVDKDLTAFTVLDGENIRLSRGNLAHQSRPRHRAGNQENPFGHYR
jgi:predicted CopG family antitoxin